ncbi:hypothetical protein, partial [Pseudomonas aeruginosa]
QFHWTYSDLPASDKYQHLRDWALEQSVSPIAFVPGVGGALMLGSVLMAAYKDLMGMRQSRV